MASRPTRQRIRGERLARKCETLKVGHASREAALDAAEAQMREGRVDPGCHVMPYACARCGEWHLRNERIVFSEPPANLARHDFRRWKGEAR
jgi:hypothetical protein